jgi:hypothetical protein
MAGAIYFILYITAMAPHNQDTLKSTNATAVSRGEAKKLTEMSLESDRSSRGVIPT